MPLDGVASNYLHRELAQALIGKRLERIYQPAKFDLQLYFRSRDRGNERLLISANPAAPHLHLLSGQRENPRNAPNFCMMLRKYLLGAVLVDLQQSEGERVFEFVFSARDDLGDKVTKYLVVEIIGRYSNIILLNQERVIHDCLVHVDSGINRVREVMPARRYQAPPALPQPSISEVAVMPRQQLLQRIKQDAVFENCDLVKSLLQLVRGLSPSLAREVIFRSHLDSRLQIRNLFEADLFALLEELQNFCGELSESHDFQHFQPTLYYADAECQQVIDFHALSLTHLPYQRHMSSLSEVIEAFYREKNSSHSLEQHRQQIQREIEQRLKKLNKKIQIHERDVAVEDKLDTWQRYGELLTCQLHQIKPGVDRVELIDYYQEDLPNISVPLVPSLSPKANAERYFKKYNKGKVAIVTAREFLEREYAELTWLESLSSALQVAENQLDLDLLAEELKTFAVKNDKVIEKSQERHLPGKPGKKKYKPPVKAKKVMTPSPLPLREFRNREGVRILAGRNNLQNDRLTVKQARKNYVWFHVKSLPGSHVVAEIDGAQISDQTLLEAAQVAAWYSGAKSNLPTTINGGKVAVDYCPVKHVKKPKKAKPGMVIYDDYATINVNLVDPETFLENLCPAR